MSSSGFGFAFDESTSLTPVDDEDEGSRASSDRTPRATGRTTERLAREAEKEMNEMKGILDKLGTGTATREEKARLKLLNGKLSKMREDLEKKTATRGSDAELDALRSESRDKARSLMITFKEKQVRSVIRAVCAAEQVDLAFILDCTSSMQPFIESVKENIKTIVRQIASTNGNLRLRLAVVAYRDLSDGLKRFEVMNFVSSVSEFEAFVGKLQAQGGADAPEDIAGGIQQANGLSWSYSTRVAFLIADFPCHGLEFHSLGDDSYPSGTPGISIIQEFQKLAQNRTPNGTMNLHFGRITTHTDQMIARFKSAYAIDLQVVSVEDTATLKASVTSSVRRSIFKTMTIAGADKAAVSFALPADVNTLMDTVVGRGGSRKAQLKRFSLVSRVPSDLEWLRCPALQVKVYRNSKITSVASLQAPIGFGMLQVKKLLGTYAAAERTNKTTENTMFMRRATNPFAQGEIRIAFHGQLACTSVDLNLAKSTMVLKSFKHHGKGVNDRDQYLKQMEVSTIAHFLSELYNQSTTAKPAHCASVHFLPVCVVEEEASTRETLGERRFCAEPPLPSAGPFLKYSNNTGYWDEDKLDESLLRFTEWTFTITKGYLMITDLQGVKSGTNKFYLTDPVILCKDIIRFGNTNLGEQFMRKCIDSTRSHLKERGWS